MRASHGVMPGCAPTHGTTTSMGRHPTRREHGHCTTPLAFGAGCAGDGEDTGVLTGDAALRLVVHRRHQHHATQRRLVEQIAERLCVVLVRGRQAEVHDVDAVAEAPLQPVGERKCAALQVRCPGGQHECVVKQSGGAADLVDGGQQQRELGVLATSSVCTTRRRRSVARRTQRTCRRPRMVSPDDARPVGRPER